MIEKRNKIIFGAIIVVVLFIGFSVMTDSFSTVSTDYLEVKDDLITMRIYFPDDYSTVGPASYNYYGKENITIRYYFEITSTNIHLFLNTMFVENNIDIGTSKHRKVTLFHYEGGYKYRTFIGEYTLDYADFGDSWHTFIYLGRVLDNQLDATLLTFYWQEEIPATTIVETETNGTFSAPLPLMIVPFVILALRKKQNNEN